MNVWRWKVSWRDNIRDVLEGLGWDIFSIFSLKGVELVWNRGEYRLLIIFSHLHWVKTLLIFTHLLPFSQPLWYVLLSTLYINIYNFVLAFFVPSPLLGWYLKYVFQTIECWYWNKGGFGLLPLAILLHTVYLSDNEPSKRAQAMHLINWYVWEGRKA